MIPAFDYSNDDTIWFDSKHGQPDQPPQTKNSSQISTDEHEFNNNEKINTNMQSITFVQACDFSTSTTGIFPTKVFKINDDEFRFSDGGEGKGIANKNNPAYSLVAEALL